MTTPHRRLTQATQMGKEEEPQLSSCFTEQLQELERDRLAQEIAEEIKSKPDSDTYEYGAAIFRTPGGSYRRSELDKSPDEVDCRGTGELTISFPMPAGSQVVGDVHNHPRECFGTDNSAPCEDDWSFTESTYFGDPPLASKEFFAMYIVGPDGRLAEFEYDDRRERADSSHRDDAAGAKACES